VPPLTEEEFIERTNTNWRDLQVKGYGLIPCGCGNAACEMWVPIQAGVLNQNKRLFDTRNGD
jgi:hypothetical protein